MAQWGDSKLFFCCVLFIACYCTVTLAQIPMDCCLSFKNKTIDKRRIVDFRQQSSGKGCSIDATVLWTRHGRTLCVPADEPWVREVMKYVVHLKDLCKKKPKDRRCVRVKHV
ncbi:CC chemokine [Scophthalmus maximus]|uniref:CC chemokine n=1 Tax=Scophthalmus maximus TaxID=52904 RepID=A0A2U9BUB7_SCOMX|nr:CC chemokine [Scophthalmus maximus]